MMFGDDELLRDDDRKALTITSRELQGANLEIQRLQTEVANLQTERDLLEDALESTQKTSDMRAKEADGLRRTVDKLDTLVHQKTEQIQTERQARRKLQGLLAQACETLAKTEHALPEEVGKWWYIRGKLEDLKNRRKQNEESLYNLRKEFDVRMQDINHVGAELDKKIHEMEKELV